MFPPVRGTHEMVAAANIRRWKRDIASPPRGGNAVGCRSRIRLAAAVTEQSRFGLAGKSLLIKMAGKPVIAISGVGTAPAKQRRPS